jgi:uncharacterized membrane protein YhaH (DUF805 family)
VPTFLQQLKPFGLTSRRDYWLAAVPVMAVAGLIVALRDFLPASAMVSVLIALQLALAVLTLRRLHDAGYSRWWALLALFPIGIDMDVFHVRFGMSEWHFFDVSMLIRYIPVIIAMIAPTAVRAIAEIGPLPEQRHA